METLSSSVLKLRNLFLQQFNDLGLDKVSIKLNELLEVEKDEIKRIVILASRVETIRKRIEAIYSDEKNIRQVVNALEPKKSDASENVTATESNKSNWVRVIIKESTEVNGVRFPEGIQIDVTDEDSKRLIETGKATILN
tara:strand:+ start:287 stop:706 length:420 start_codon:yes stop_codon:yes gene_type:complete